jgi:copper chaperone CopZ
MNFKKSMVVVALATVLFASCKQKSTEIVLNKTSKTTTVIVKKEIAAANLQTASFNVEGMTCAVGCAKTIQEDLTKLDGVQEATVNFETKLAKVTFDKTVQTPEKLIKVVESAADGKTYKVLNMKS